MTTMITTNVNKSIRVRSKLVIFESPPRPNSFRISNRFWTSNRLRTGVVSLDGARTSFGGILRAIRGQCMGTFELLLEVKTVECADFSQVSQPKFLGSYIILHKSVYKRLVD